jgi:alpha-tubulin suppressor-like RCC1 family protein
MSPPWFKTKVLTIFSLILFSFLLVGCGSGGGGDNSNTTPLSSSKNIIDFSFNSSVIKSANISGTDINITIDYYSTDLIPKVTHTGKDYYPKGAINLKDIPKVYTITAQNNTSKSYNVTVRRAFIVSDEKELTNAINTITNATKNDPISYITILIQNDINLTGTNNRVIPDSWKGRNIILENNSTASNVTVRGLAVKSDDRVGLIDVNIDRVITAVAAGEYHSLALDGDGKLWASGANNYGQLGLDHLYAISAITSETLFQPVTIKGLASNAKIISIATGSRHSLALDSDGKLWATGWNDDGQLGLGNNSDQTSFQLVTSGSISNATIVSIAAGRWHSFAIDSNGTLWATGWNLEGQLGLGNNSHQSSFQPVTIPNFPSDAHIVSVAAGTYHSVALDSTGKLWATGKNKYGELGLGNYDNQTSFQPVTSDSISNKNITSIAAGEQHSLAVTSDGKLWASGLNNYGQLGLGNILDQNSFQHVTISALSSKIVSIAAGWHNSFALDSDGKLWATGRNSNNQLGLSGTIGNSLFQHVTIPQLAQNATTISIAAGGEHFLVLDSDGRPLATGWNDDGQLGLGDYDNRSVFTPVSVSF